MELHETTRYKSGEALLYNHALLHGSPPNNTPVNRIGIVIGLVHKDAELQLYANDKGVIKCYKCDENFFLSKNPLLDFVNLPIKTTIADTQKPITLKEFLEIFGPQRPDRKEPALESTNPSDNRTFLKNTPSATLLPKSITGYLNPNIAVTPPFQNQSRQLLKDVAKFYDEQTDNFLKVYGNVIQAFRTKDVGVL